MSRSPTHKSERKQALLVLAEWSPAIEVSENEKEYLIKAELSEVKKEDVKVIEEKGTLTIVAHRKFETERKTRNVNVSNLHAAVSGAPSRSRMMPARATSAPSSKTTCWSCT